MGIGNSQFPLFKFPTFQEHKDRLDTIQQHFHNMFLMSYSEYTKSGERHDNGKFNTLIRDSLISARTKEAMKVKAKEEAKAVADAQAKAVADAQAKASASRRSWGF